MRSFPTAYDMLSEKNFLQLRDGNFEGEYTMALSE